MTPASPRRDQGPPGSGEDPVALGGHDVLGQVQQVVGVDLAQLVAGWLPSQDAPEGGPGHLGIGLTGRGVRPDVGRNAVELVERHLPAPCTGASGVDQGLVHVEEYGDWLGHLGHVVTALARGPALPSRTA